MRRIKFFRSTLLPDIVRMNLYILLPFIFFLFKIKRMAPEASFPCVAIIAAILIGAIPVASLIAEGSDPESIFPLVGITAFAVIGVFISLLADERRFAMDIIIVGGILIYIAAAKFAKDNELSKWKILFLVLGYSSAIQFLAFSLFFFF